MARNTSLYVCQQCGYESAKWMGKCPNCGEWNSFVETTRFMAKGQKTKGKSAQLLKPQSLASVETKKLSRITTNISELDRVLGGGIVPGQAILLAGEPGVGKSTILLQLADKLENVLYISGEESTAQIKLRAGRLDIKRKDIL